MVYASEMLTRITRSIEWRPGMVDTLPRELFGKSGSSCTWAIRECHALRYSTKPRNHIVSVVTLLVRNLNKT